MPSGTMIVDPSASAGGGASGEDPRNAPRRRPRLVEADLKHALGYFGAALLFVGLFLPLVEVPGLGSLNYFWSSGAGVLLLLLVATSVGALATHRFWSLWLTGAAACASIVVTLVRAVVRAEPLEAGARATAAPSSLHGALAQGLERGLSEAVQLQWGWPILVLGSLLLMASAEVARREGHRAPGFFRDLVMATGLLVAMLVIGPPVLSRTHKVFVDFRAEERQEERLRWVPHESAREKMAATRAHTREQELTKLAQAEAARREQELARQRANDPHARRVRLVNDVRRWYPRFAATMRPVVEARDAFVREYRASGLPAATDACRALVETLRGTGEVYPRSPDRKLHDAMTRLIELGVELDRICDDSSAAAPAGAQLAASAERVEAVLEELRAELAGYCLELPGGYLAAGPGAASTVPPSVYAAAPGEAWPFDPRWMLALR